MIPSTRPARPQTPQRDSTQERPADPQRPDEKGTATDSPGAMRDYQKSIRDYLQEADVQRDAGAGPRAAGNAGL